MRQLLLLPADTGPKIRDDQQTLQHIHYITDSPSSQYRHIHIFSVLAKHQQLLGTDTSWLYFEAGHGKGPCDGISGSSKRMADDYVRRGHSILTAADYAKYGDSSGTEYLVVTKDDIGESRLALDAMMTSTTVKGTMTYHAAVCLQHGVLMMPTTPCYGSCCFHHGEYVLGCQGWTEHVLFPQPPPVPTPHRPADIKGKGRNRRRPSLPGVPGRITAVANFDAIYF